MNKFLLNILAISTMVVSSYTFAETYNAENYINVLNNEVLSLNDAMIIKSKESKNMEDYIQLGDFYIFNDMHRDTFKSFDYFQKASVRGSEYAKLMVGYMTFKGYGTDVNIFKGDYLLKDVKKPYDKNALYILGKLYMEREDFEKAIKLFEQVKDEQSYAYLTDMLINLQRYEEALPYLDWMIKSENSSIAKRELAIIYLSKAYSKEKEAVELLTSAAKNGDSESQYLLGLYYKKGTMKTKASMKDAVKWFSIATQNNHSFATKELLEIWNENMLNNDIYELKNDPYLTKLVNDKLTEQTENRIF